ncbi:hypothetical protein CFC21_073733 [Triticum aestivum]|uniref:Uncharacterized protein n=3 Tax=Triticum TaxID=4564 RepID=A0A9R0XIB1_TRITD|nr:hypothetical protein CFC21_073733 [Triticum aestivum]WIL07205.1 putative nitrate transporter-1 isoform [Triticum aestivum]VAI37299.1 unnamed protein product [Triticum turgidum subsp. durum]
MVSAGGHGGYSDADDAVDFRGKPVDKSKTGGWLGAGLILGTELAERVCVIGISMNLVTYLVGELHLSNAKSANVVTNFMGTLNLLALVGGFLADAKLGRYLTIACSATIAAAGVSLLTVDTVVPSMRPPPCVDARGAQGHECVPASGGQLALLYVALYVIAAGAGGLKANVSGFGSDQFDGRNPREERAMDNVGRGWGYGVSAAAMALGVLVLVAGTSKYRYRRPAGSPLTVIGRVLWTAWKKRKLPTPANADELNGFHTAKVAHTDRLRCLDKAAVMEPVDLAASPTKQEQASASTMTEVEEVKMVLNLLPIWSTCILFWTIYSQMTTFSVEQATRMDRRLNAGFEIPAGSLSVFLFLSILLFTSLNERLLVPLAGRLTGRPQGLTSLQRVGTGLVFATVAMVVSALVEKMRRDAANGEPRVAISAFWLVPQFFLVGAGEAFAYVGQLEFFIREAPERMKSMSTGLFLVTLSMGFFLSSFLVFLVHTVTRGAWIRNNLDRGRLDLFYWMLAVLGVVNFLVFVVIARRHEYKPSTSVVVAPAGEDNDTKEKEMDDVLVVNENTVGMDV